MNAEKKKRAISERKTSEFKKFKNLNKLIKKNFVNKCIFHI
jgi:hypothetical protein